MHEREILGGPTGRGNAIRINGNGNRNIMLKVSQWKQIIGLLSVAQRANERPRERASERTGERISRGLRGSSARWKWRGIEFSDPPKLSMATVELRRYETGES